MVSIDEIDKSLIADKKLPDFHPGDKIRVYTKLKEGDKTRTQKFEGTVISRRGQGLRETFTVRKLSAGYGVERIFPLHMLNLDKLEVVKKGKARRAKLFYIRKKK
ncbi:50S ribosomal protein L19 [candidate division WOR-3 bacterium]|nr:50S ribosomal protein L19 [candidate division WOR-3 bacterium]